MNLRLLKLGILSKIAVAVLAVTAFTATEANAHYNKKRTPGCDIYPNGVHYCNSGAREESNGNDPRAEHYFPRKIPYNDTSVNERFEANVFVNSANNTTFFQLLNDSGCSGSGCDRYKPVLFLTAWKQSNGRLKICADQGCGTRNGRGAWNNVPAGFRLKVLMSGRTAKVTINGQTRTIDIRSAADGTWRGKGAQQVRWGVYHHHVRNGRAASRAQIRLYNLLISGI